MSESKVDKMDLSLDDIIKMGGKRGRSGSGGGFRGQGFRRGRGGSGGGGGGGGQRRNNDFGRGRGVARGGVDRRRDFAAPYSRPRQVPDVWKHDLYNDGDAPVAPVQTFRPVEPFMRNVDQRKPKLIISNLDFGVNDQDIEELFGEFGHLKRFAVHYDKSGRSLGTADVEYETLADAMKALKQYNNVPLDGKPMKIRMEGDDASSSDDSRPRSMSSRLGPVDSSASRRPANVVPLFNSRSEDRGPNRSRFQGQQQRGRGGPRRGQGRGQGRGGSGRGRDRGSAPSKEDLDAELDAYNAKMDAE